MILRRVVYFGPDCCLGEAYLGQQLIACIPARNRRTANRRIARFLDELRGALNNTPEAQSGAKTQDIRELPPVRQQPTQDTP